MIRGNLLKKLSIKISKIFSLYSLIISIIGLGIISFLTFNQSISKIALPFQRQIIGLIFASICSLGIIAGISPKRCSQRIHSRIPKKEQITLKDERIKGHHPVCENFSNHVVKFGKRTYCIGCIGMVTGAIISLVGSIFYFFTDSHFGNFNVIIFLLGFLEILYGLTFFSLINVGKITRFFSNVIYVIGAFFLLVGIDGITNNFLLEFYLIIVIIFWIIARITLSQYKHRKICDICALGSCIFNEKEN